MKRRDLFKAAATFAALLVLPAPLRRISAESSASWFAEVPVPDGWGMQSVFLGHDGTVATWRVVLAKFGPDTPIGWFRMAGSDKMIPCVLQRDGQAPGALETQTVEGTFEARVDRWATILLDVARPGVLRMSWRDTCPYRWRSA